MKYRYITILDNFKLDHSRSGSVNLMSEIFNLNKDLFISNGYKVVYLKEYVIDTKFFNKDYNYTLTDSHIKQVFIDTTTLFFNKIKDDLDFDNSIMIGFQPFGICCFHNHIDTIKKKNIKTIMWHDDLQAFARNKNRLFLDGSTGRWDGPELIEASTDYRVNNIDLILTPSKIYFENVKSPYLSKTEQFFYCINEYNGNSDVNFDLYSTRINKIILSGTCSNEYKLRNDLVLFIRANKSHPFTQYIYHLPNGTNDRAKNTTTSTLFFGSDYYKKLKEYKAAIVPFANYPLNFCLAKHIEVLMCGTLAFFEHSYNLEKYLGMKPFEHYIPIKLHSSGDLDYDIDYYLEYLNTEKGKQIAMNGHRHIMEHFKSRDRCRQLIDILSQTLVK